MNRWIRSLILCLALFFCGQTIAEAQTVEFVGRKLQVNGQPFLVKGINSSVYPISTFPTEFGVCWHDPAQPSGFYCPPPPGIKNAHDVDFLVNTMIGLTKALNGNTYRTFGEIGVQPSPMLQRASQYGVKVIMGYWIDYNLDFTFPLPNGPAQRQQLINDFAAYVNWLKNDPNYSEVLMFGLSNENNLYWCSFATSNPSVCTQCDPDAQSKGFHDLVDDMAVAAKAGDPDPRPIIIVSAALGDIGNANRNADDANLPNIDGWGVNSYSGNTFGTMFSDYSALTQKGVIITEFGMDAFDHRPTATSTFGSIDEATQEQYIESLWNEIKAEYQNPSGVSAGGVVFHLADGWFGNDNWTVAVSQHNPSVGGWYSGAFPDGKLDGEFLGLFERRPGAAKFVDDLVPRSSAFKVQQLYGLP